MCRLAKRAGARQVVYVSTIFAHYERGQPLHGIYGLSKRHGEELAHLYCDGEGLGLTILRPAQLYDSEGGCRRHQGLFYRIVDCASKGADVDLWGSNDALRNYLHVDDLADAIRAVIDRGVTGDFNCVHPQAARLTEVAQAAFDAFQRGGRVRFVPDKPDIPDLPVGPWPGVHAALGLAPAISLAEGMRRIRQGMGGA